MSAFRMNWSKQDDNVTRNMWDNIVTLRERLDDLVQNVPGIAFFVSAINATHSLTKTPVGTQHYKVFPGVAYWLVTYRPIADRREFCTMLQDNDIGATLKLQLQPYQQSDREIRNALFAVVKDNMEGCVRRMVDTGANAVPGVPHPLVRLYNADDEFAQVLEPTLYELHMARFATELRAVKIPCNQETDGN